MLYIFLAPGDNHTPLYIRQRVETRSKRKEKTSVALLLLVSPSTRGDSSPPPPPHTALLYSQQWCWLQFSLIPLSTWSSSYIRHQERDAHCLCTRTQCPRGPFTIQYKLLGADAAAAAALLLLPNCHYLIRRKRKLYDGCSEANKTSRGPLFSFSRAVGLIARCISFNPNNKQLCCWTKRERERQNGSQNDETRRVQEKVTGKRAKCDYST